MMRANKEVVRALERSGWMDGSIICETLTQYLTVAVLFCKVNKE